MPAAADRPLEETHIVCRFVRQRPTVSTADRKIHRLGGGFSVAMVQPNCVKFLLRDYLISGSSGWSSDLVTVMNKFIHKRSLSGDYMKHFPGMFGTIH